MLLMPATFSSHAGNTSPENDNSFVLTVAQPRSAAMGLPELSTSTLHEGSKEIRIWSGLSTIDPYKMLRIVIDENGQVTGEVFLSYLAETSHRHDPDSIDFYKSIKRQCKIVGATEKFEACKLKHVPKASIKELYRELETYEILTLPDQNDVPSSPKDVEIVDGSGLDVEVRVDDSYRVYGWANPAFRYGTEAHKASAIQSAVIHFMHSVLRPL